MRTEVHLEGELLTEAERFALARGATLQALVEEAVRRLLRDKESRRPESMPELPTWGTGWLRPGVNLDRNVDLLDLMDPDDAPF